MKKERYTAKESPFIRVESCQGDLIVRGWAESSLEVKGDFLAQESEKGVTITSQGNLYLYMPSDTVLSAGKIGGDLNVRQALGSGLYEYVQGDVVLSSAGDTELGVVHGDFAARNLIGSLSVNEVNGDAVMRGIRQAVFNEVHGDLSARVVDGSLTISSINGDADLRTINGDVTIEQSYRDVNLSGVNGVISVTDVRGDVRLRGGLIEENHSVEARGDIVVRWPAGMPVNITASAMNIDNRLPLEDLTEGKGTLSGRIGNSESNLNLATDGRIILRESDMSAEKNKYYHGNAEIDIGFDMAGIAARIEAEVNNHLSRVTRDLETKYGADFGRRVSEKVTRKAEKMAERASRQSARSSGFDYSQTMPPKMAVSTEEQLKILKMVETGKISPEEASMLLEALEA